MANHISGRAPVYIKPGTRLNPDVKDKQALKKADKKYVNQAQRETEALGKGIKKENLKQQREREFREDKERGEQREWLTEHAADPSMFEPDTADPTLLRIAKYYGVDMELWGDYRDKIALLNEWAELESKSNHYVDKLWALRRLENKVEMNWGDDRVNSLYRYVRLDLDQKRIEKERDLYKK